MIDKKTAILIGATGLTGSHLLNVLLDDERYSKIIVFGRRSCSVSHPKLQEHLINFDYPDQWRDLVKGDVLFSCLGTTLKRAGGKDKQYTIDYTYQLQFAQAASSNNVGSYVLVSSTGANSKSAFFYMRMKGQLEEQVQTLSFEQIHIMRPNILDGPRLEKRHAENFSLKIIHFLNTIGLFKKMKPTHVSDLSKEMADIVFTGKPL